MENQPPTTNASAWLSRKPAVPDDVDVTAELARLKERLSFYESFDSLIQDSVSRAGELLRHAVATRESAEQQLAESRRELELLRTGDRQEHRSLLSDLLDDVTTMQVQIERLARRVSDALDDIEVSLPAGGQLQSLSASATAPAVDTAPPLPIEPTMDELLPPEPPGEAEHGAPEIESAHKAEAEVVAAEADVTASLDAVEAPDAPAESPDAVATAPENIAELDALFDEPDAIESPAVESAASEHAPDNPDTTLVMDEVVQEPADEPEAGAIADEAEPGDESSIGDGVLSGDSASPEPEPAPAAPAEENTVEPAAEATETAEPESEPAPEPEPELVASSTESVVKEEPAPSRLPWISSDIRPFSVDAVAGSGVRRSGTGELRMPQPQRTSVSTSTLVAPEGLSTAVLVHGVPRATTALSLKRYLEGLTHVLAVEPREYAEGVLRLHVTGQRTLNLDDLRGWADGGALEPVYVRDDLIEVRLPS